MKPTYLLLALVILLLSFVCPIRAAKVPLEWDDTDNPPAEIMAYPLYLKLAPDAEGQFVQVASVLAQAAGAPEAPIPFDLTLPGPGRRLCYVTAVSHEGVDSPPSETISFYAPKAPMRLRIAGATVSLQSSDDMQDWKVEEVFYMDRSARRRFYRTSFDF